MNFNSSQINAINKVMSLVTNPNPNSLFLTAPAASGKTATAMGMVKALIENGIEPNQILLTSFTVAGRKAFEEKAEKEGVIYQSKVNKNGVNIKTLHSFFLEMINMTDSGRKVYYNPVPSHNKSGSVGRKKGKAEKADNFENFDEFMEAFLTKYPKFKSLYSLATFRAYYIDYAKHEGRVCPDDLKRKFDEYFQSGHTITYDHILKTAQTRLINPNSAPKKKDYINEMVNRYKVIIVDEFQDNKPIMFENLAHIKRLNPKVLLVFIGDVNQMLYQSMNNISKSYIESMPLYEQGEFCNLDVNYRSNERLVELFNNYINYSQTLNKSFQSAGRADKSVQGEVAYLFTNNALDAAQATLDFEKRHPNLKILSSNNALKDKDNGLDSYIKNLRELGMDISLSITSDGSSPLEYFNAKVSDLQRIVYNHRDQLASGIAAFLNHTSLNFGSCSDWETIDTVDKLKDYCSDNKDVYDFIEYIITNLKVPTTKDSAYMRRIAMTWGLSCVSVDDLLERKIVETSHGANTNSYDTFYKAKGLEFDSVVVLITPSGTMFWGPGGITPLELVECEFYTLITRAKNNLLIIFLDDVFEYTDVEALRRSRNRIEQMEGYADIQEWCEENLPTLQMEGN